ncbi:TatD family [Phlyctochytrium arcticum]|nr:TatD family [Phlyctochytrium arcticum]
MTDAHNHIVDTPDNLSSFDDLQTQQVWVMGTRPENWEAVRNLSREHPDRVIPAFGIHPWFAAQYAQTSPSDLQNSEVWSSLKSYLASCSNAMIGEIGIDSVARDRATNEKFSFSDQLLLFKAQMELGAELRRPVNVHVVKCHGYFVDIVQQLAGKLPVEKNMSKKERKESRITDKTIPDATATVSSSDPLPPKIMLHSFSGSAETVKALLRLPHGVGGRFYFSFSLAINGRSNKMTERVRAVPDDRILLETDLHDIAQVDTAMLESCRMVAEAKGWSMGETVTQTNKNAKEFLTSGVAA